MLLIHSRLSIVRRSTLFYNSSCG